MALPEGPEDSRQKMHEKDPLRPFSRADTAEREIDCGGGCFLEGIT